MNRLISLTSDFGIRDEYSSAVKAVILSIYPEAKIVDVTHVVPKYDIEKAALVLRSAVKFFPSGSIHLAVVDPGVGSDRDILIIETSSGKLLVGPDNGVLYPCAVNEGVSRIVKFRNPTYRLNQVSSTFHGRDIMAPIAAYLAKGVPIGEFGPETSDIVKLELERLESEGSRITGYVLDIDSYGNVVTSIPSSILADRKIDLDSQLSVSAGKVEAKIFLRRTFSEGRDGELILLAGSKGLLEISINRGNAARRLRIRKRSKVELNLNR